jgi:O-antigen ligase
MKTPFRAQMLLALLYTALLVCVATLTHAPNIAKALYLAGAIVTAGITRRISPWLYLTAMLWFWLGTSFARRLMEWHAGFNSGNIVLVAPMLMALPIFWDIFTARALLKRRGIAAPLILLACVLYALFVSFCQGEILAGLLASTDWLFPMLFMFHFLVHAGRVNEAEAHLAAFMPIAVLPVAAYGIFQWAHMPEWDGQWFVDSGFGTVAYPLSPGNRAFSTLNNAGFLAAWCGFGIILLSYFRSALGVLAAGCALVALALAQVRSLYISTFIGILASGFLGRARLGRLGVLGMVAAAALYAGAEAADPVATDQIVSRFTSIQSLGTDESAQARLEILQSVPGQIAENPFGTGIGAEGRGRAAANGPVSTANIDNGFLAILLAMGWLAGPIYIVSIVWLALKTLNTAKASHSALAGTLAAASLVPLGMLPFIYFNGLAGVLLWSCFGYVIALDQKAQFTARTFAHAETRRQNTLPAAAGGGR